MPSLRKTSRWLFLTLALPVAGCATFQDSHYEHVQQLKTECAWMRYWWCLDECTGSDYARGWKAGYMNVLTGGCGKAPLVPPHCYWKPSINGGNCEQKRLDWYCGWEEGALMASMQPDTHYIKVWNPPTCPPPAVVDLPMHMMPDTHGFPFEDGKPEFPTPAPGAVDGIVEPDKFPEPTSDVNGLPIPPTPPAASEETKTPPAPPKDLYFPPQGSAGKTPSNIKLFGWNKKSQADVAAIQQTAAQLEVNAEPLLSR